MFRDLGGHKEARDIRETCNKSLIFGILCAISECTIGMLAVVGDGQAASVCPPTLDHATMSFTMLNTAPVPQLGNSGADPIDLTGIDNDDDELPMPDAKRARVNGTPAAFIPHMSSKGDHLLARSHHNPLNMLQLPPLSQPLPREGPLVPQLTPQSFQARNWSSQPTPVHIQHQLDQLTKAQHQTLATARTPHVTPVPPTSHVGQRYPPNVIDLTRDQSPAFTSPSPQPSGYPRQTLVLDDSLAPTTAILIGQINVSALVLSPVPYIMQQQTHTVMPNGQIMPAGSADYVPVKLRAPSENPDAHDILIYTPSQARNGNVLAPDNFAVVETKVAARLHPLMCKRAIKLEAMIKTVQPGSNMLVAPLAVLVFTAKGNVSQVADALFKSGLLLERPSPMWGPVLSSVNLIYHNPHHGQSLPVAQSAPSSRWASPAVSAKSVETQRSSADTVFQKLRGEEDLPETSPGDNISTPLYPHQKKALSFLLEREQELVLAKGKAASLWHCNGSGWQNSVTQEIVFSKPAEPKCALLADDMGLGKTLETLCLLATTVPQAEQFAAEPFVLPSPPEPFEEEPSTEGFGNNAVWDMPNLKKLSLTKEKKKAMHEKAVAEYNRMTRIKEKTKATLIVCPLSTIVSWEDQIKDHWGGDVTVIGGVGSNPPPPASVASSVTGDMSDLTLLSDGRLSEAPRSTQPSRQPSPVSGKKGQPIRIYIYHGASRRADPQYISKFDIVITTYSTLSSEYSKQMRAANPDAEDEEGVSSDSGIIELDENGNAVPKKKAKSRRKRAFTPGDCGSPLQAIYWFRVVLDEAHFIKEPTTVASRACCDLVADRRLCLTGTPLQNKVDDVYALIKFLRVKPFDEKGIWTNLIGGPIKYNQAVGFTRLQTIMRLLALRRTKETKDQNGKPILTLPPRTDRMVLLKLQDEERTIYDSFFGESQAEFMNMGRAEVMKNYVNILQRILRLRQICDDVELVKASKDGHRYDCAAEYEEAIKGIEVDGINLERATAIFALMRDTSTAQCVECGMELSTVPTEGGPDAVNEGQETPVAAKRGRKPKSMPSSTTPSLSATRQGSPCAMVHPIVTRCTHLFCLCCFRAKICASWPCAPADTRGTCSVCQLELSPTVDAIEVQSDGTDHKRKDFAGAAGMKRVRRARGEPIANYKPSTKVLALLQELMPFSKRNPYSANYEPTEVDDVQEVDGHGNRVDSGIVKSVVFSQWTSMLDKIEDALETAGIYYERLDGGMKREERNKALDALKNDPKCEVLLVSLKAGGVGLTLTAARNVYLMDPYWNPAVENQAIDRIHRLGQIHPVVSTKFIIENSIEQRLLEVQKKKADLAKLTLGKPLNKQDLQQQRMEELQNLLGTVVGASET